MADSTKNSILEFIVAQFDGRLSDENPPIITFGDTNYQVQLYTERPLEMKYEDFKAIKEFFSSTMVTVVPGRHDDGCDCCESCGAFSWYETILTVKA